MLAAIDLNNEAQIATYEICEIRSNRLLTHEFEVGKLPVAKMRQNYISHTQTSQGAL